MGSADSRSLANFVRLPNDHLPSPLGADDNPAPPPPCPAGVCCGRQQPQAGLPGGRGRSPLCARRLETGGERKGGAISCEPIRTCVNSSRCSSRRGSSCSPEPDLAAAACALSQLGEAS